MDDLNEFLENFWLKKVGIVVYGRMILQIPCVLLLLYASVARPGAILSTNIYKTVGLKYEVIGTSTC